MKSSPLFKALLEQSIARFESKIVEQQQLFANAGTPPATEKAGCVGPNACTCYPSYCGGATCGGFTCDQTCQSTCWSTCRTTWQIIRY